MSTTKPTTRPPEDTQEDPHLGYYVLDVIYGELRALAKEYEFLNNENVFRQLVMSFEETRTEHSPSLERVRDVHLALIRYLEEIDPETKEAQAFTVPEGLRNFDTIVEKIQAQRENEQITESRQSAADSVILGETYLDEIVLTHRAAVRDLIIQSLGEITLLSGEEEVDSEKIIAEIGEDEVIELLMLENSTLEKRREELGVEIVRIIIEARSNIKEGLSSGARQKFQREEETERLILPNDKNPRRTRNEIIPQISLRDLIAKGSLTRKEEIVVRLRHGIGERADFQLESQCPPELTETRARVAAIENEALKKIKGKRPGEPNLRPVN